MFGFTKTIQDDERLDEILNEIKSTSKKLSEIEGKYEGTREELKLSDDIIRLKRQLTNLEIEKDRVQEERQREKREVEHMVGLERKRSEFDLEAAKRDTTLTIREENLAADRERFEDNMEFMTRRFDSEVKYLKELMGEILDRLPHVEVSKKLSVVNGTNTDEDD